MAEGIILSVKDQWQINFLDNDSDILKDDGNDSIVNIA